MSTALIATIIFIAVLVVLLSDKIDRTIVALVGASLMFGFSTFLGFYDEHLAVEAIDFETLAPLFGMMVLVALLRPTGVFDYLAIAVSDCPRNVIEHRGCGYADWRSS